MKFEMANTNSSLKKLLSLNKVSLAYAFGSQVDGTASADSDLDLAILFKPGLTKMQRFNLRLLMIGKLEKIFNLKIDLIVLNDTRSLFFKHVIVSEGSLLFKDSEDEYLDFECKLMNEYFDFKPFMDLQNKNYVERSL